LDKKRDIFNQIDYNISSGQKSKGLKVTKREFKYLFKKGNFDQRHFKFLINRLKTLNSDYGLKRVFKKLGKYPNLADVFSNYLGVFMNRQKVRQHLFGFIKSEQNIYEWQEMWILRTILKSKRLTRNELNKIRQRINEDNHWINICLLFLILGKFGDTNDGNFIKDRYPKETNNLIKRAIIIACQKLPLNERNAFYKGISVSESQFKTLINLIKGTKTETWG